MLDMLKAYAKENIVAMIFIAYYVVGIALYTMLDIDILLPCIITLITGESCPGCGITRAFIDILQFDFVCAYHSNPLIFIVLPIVIYAVVSDFMKFKRNYEKQKTL